jgi:hypothetical protein
LDRAGARRSRRRIMRAEIEGAHEEHAIDFIAEVKIVNLPRRRGPYLQFLTHSMSFDIPEWLLLEQVDDCEQRFIFLYNEKWNNFSKEKDYLDFAGKFPTRKVIVNK